MLPISEMLPTLRMSTPLTPALLDARPATFRPATVVMTMAWPLSSAPGRPVVCSVTDLAADSAVSTRICWPAVTAMVESGPSHSMPVPPTMPPATSAPCSSTSCAPVMVMWLPAASEFSVELALT